MLRLAGLVLLSMVAGCASAPDGYHAGLGQDHVHLLRWLDSTPLPSIRF